MQNNVGQLGIIDDGFIGDVRRGGGGAVSPQPTNPGIGH